MSKKQAKYSKLYHESLDKKINDEIESLLDKINSIRKKSKEAFPFQPNDKVGIMHAGSGKFKFFAYFKELQTSDFTHLFWVKYQKESINGKKDKLIRTMYADEFMVPANEVDITNLHIQEPFTLNGPLKL